MQAHLDTIFQLASTRGCSDIHLTPGLPPMLRRHGALVPLESQALDAEALTAMLHPLLTAEQAACLAAGTDVTCTYTHASLGRLRVQLFPTRGGMHATCRIIPGHIPPLESLGIPSVQDLVRSPQGLVLVTGALGHGKSTTLAAMIDYLNRTRTCSIVTIEQPIEFVHTSRSALIIQRQVGTHVPSVAEGLRAALREDPDVILLGELPDVTTFALALSAAETGHLVLGALPTTGVMHSFAYLLAMVPEAQHAPVTALLAQVLRGVVSQVLVKTAHGNQRKAVAEVLVMTPKIAHFLKAGELEKIPLHRLDQTLIEAVQKRMIDPDDAYRHARNKQHFQRFVTDPHLLPKVSLVRG